MQLHMKEFDRIFICNGRLRQLKKTIHFQESGPTKVRRPTSSQRPAKFSASALRQRGPGEGEGGALKSNLHNQRKRLNNFSPRLMKVVHLEWTPPPPTGPKVWVVDDGMFGSTVTVLGCRYVHSHRRDSAVQLQPAQCAQRHGWPHRQRQQHPEWLERSTIYSKGLCHLIEKKYF